MPKVHIVLIWLCMKDALKILPFFLHTNLLEKFVKLFLEWTEKYQNNLLFCWALGKCVSFILKNFWKVSLNEKFDGMSHSQIGKQFIIHDSEFTIK